MSGQIILCQRIIFWINCLGTLYFLKGKKGPKALDKYSQLLIVDCLIKKM